MNRRDFVVRSSILVSGALVAGPRMFGEPAGSGGGSASGSSPKSAGAGGAAHPPTPAVTEFHPLRRNVGYFTGRGGTIGWLSSADALAVVDTQFPDTAAICLQGLPGRGSRKLDVVLNTHHHADHTGGNGVFKPASKTIVAQANVPALMRAAAEKAGTLDKQVYPDTTFPEVWRRELGDEIVTAQHYGPAHTKGDGIVHFEKANVVHMGDLVFNRLYPVIDRPGGASVQGWISRLEEAVKTYPSDAIYLFGHGNPKFGVTGGHAELNLMRDYLTALLDHVRREMAAGKTREQIAALENLPGFPDFHTPAPNRLAGNLGVAFDELSQKG